MILYARRMVRRGQSYAVNSKHSIDLKTQFVAHVLIRDSVLPRPSFINKRFRHGLDVSSSWGESGKLLSIDQWFCLLDPGRMANLKLVDKRVKELVKLKLQVLVEVRTSSGW